ncbi:F-box/LRR-repeat protein 12-like [Pogona vitticeps]
MFTTALIQILNKHWPSLHHLYLTGSPSMLPYDCIPSPLTTLVPSFSEIPFDFSSKCWEPVSPIQHFEPESKGISEKLGTRVVIRSIPASSNNHLFNISIQATLKTLVLPNTHQVLDEGIQRASLHLPKLEYFALQYCSIGDSATHFIGYHMESLNTLDLGGIFCLTVTGLPCLNSLSLLEDVSVTSCRKLSPEAMLAFCQPLPLLRHLYRI